MTRKTTLFAAATALVAALAVTAGPAEARHFGRFGFGFGYPVFYGPPLYAPPPIYYYAPRVAYIPPPAVYHYGYGYTSGYRYRRVHHYTHRVVHRASCSCNCCR